MEETHLYQEASFQKLEHSALSLSDIELELRTKGFTADVIAKFINQLKKKRVAKRQSVGFIYMAAGAFIGFLSCVFTIADIFPGHIGFVLYGLTTIAVLLVVLGLYYVFE